MSVYKTFAIVFCLLSSSSILAQGNQALGSYRSDVQYTVQKSLDFEGVKRTFLVHTPTGYDGKTSLPLVLGFHGGIGTGKQFESSTGFSQLADRENFIVVYPDGVKNQWNDGRGKAFSGPPTANDIGFVAALIEFMQKNYAVDAKRIFATGVSNGGIFANRLGVEMSDKFAAIAPVLAGLPIDSKTNRAFTPERGKTKPLAVLMINGTADEMVKWSGGPVGRRDQGEVTSTAMTAKMWSRSNACDRFPNIEELPDKFPNDGTTVRRETYSDCKDSTEVVLYAVIGGGHTWHGPSHRQPSGRNILTGKQSREIDSTEIIWQFFKKHKKR